MCENATMTVLFKQDQEWTEDFNYLRVEVRKWRSQGGSRALDYVMECHVIVDGDDVIHSHKVMDCFADHEAIREAIAKYDELYSNHPCAWGKNETIHCHTRV